MEKYFFIKPWLELLSEGKFFRRLIAVFLRVLALITPLYGLVLILVLGKQIMDLPTIVKVGGVIFVLLFVITLYMLVHILLVRAGNVDELKESDFNVVSVAVVLLRLIGELAATVITFMGVGGGIFVWFAGLDAANILLAVFNYFPRVSEPFSAGLFFVIGGVILAFVVLVLAYLKAEILLVLMAIAKNTKKSHG